MIGIVDTQRSNLGAVASALKRLDISYTVLENSESEHMGNFTHYLIPGVSSFDACVTALKERGFYDYFKNPGNLQGKKLMGICAGAQILFESSEEGTEKGLGLLPGRVLRLQETDGIQVPHLGWNNIIAHNGQSDIPVTNNTDYGKKFYFSHSYHFPANDFSAADCKYGKIFPVIVSNGIITAVQFHPEKSYHQGLQILRNFYSL